jgi:hypothetical protein
MMAICIFLFYHNSTKFAADFDFGKTREIRYQMADNNSVATKVCNRKSGILFLTSSLPKIRNMIRKVYNAPRINIYFLCASAICSLLFAACDATNKPLDAETRQVIDSISTAQIRQARLELDSVCLSQRTTVLPYLIDSIKQKRLKEIEEKLKTVPLQ